MPHERRSVRLKSGLRLSYAEHGPGDGVPVLLLHGITDSSFSFSPILPLLQSDIRAIAPDQRGHGDSDKPQTGYSIEQLAADAVELLDALQIQAATVVGHSMGSFVAQHMAVTAPERVSSLVLVGSGSSHNDVIYALRDQVADLTDPVTESFAREFQMSTIWRPLPPDFLDSVVNESRKVPARVWIGCVDAMLRHSPPLEQISCPTLLLWGDRDAVFSRPEQEDLRCRIIGAQLRIACDVGHAYHWEAPERLAAELQSLRAIAA